MILGYSLMSKSRGEHECINTHEMREGWAAGQRHDTNLGDGVASCARARCCCSWFQLEVM